MNVGIIGSGAWGQALATLVAKAGHQPRIGYRGTRPTGFPGTPNLRALVGDSELTILAVPANEVSNAIAKAQPDAGDAVVVASRGLQPDTGNWLTDIVVDSTPCRRVGALAGPAMASEILNNRPSALVIASPFDEICQTTLTALHSEICRIYTSTDMRGVELAGTMVRVLSVAVGISTGVNLGIGARGVIITRGIAEASRLGAALGAHPQTFSGLAGVGDLVSCASHPSHPSFAAGMNIAKGSPCPTHLLEEARAVLQLAERTQVDLPLTTATLAIASGEVRPRLAFDLLMRREARPE